jgi:hypothetical protein
MLDDICIPILYDLSSVHFPLKASLSVNFERFTLEGLSHNPGNVKLWESPGIAGGLPWINYAVGIGASTGLLTNVTKAWKIHLFGREIYYPLGVSHNAWEAGLHQNFTLGTNTSLRVELGFSRIYGYERAEAGLFWNIYF